MISLIIPATSHNRHYTDFVIKQIRELYPDEHSVEVVVEESDEATLGQNYNRAVAKASGEVVVLMHNDMVPHPGFVEILLKHIKPKRVLTYHRVEPPIYPEIYAGKSLLDCGYDIKDYNKQKFFNISAEDTLADGGSQIFFAVYKEDYLPIDGYVFKKFCEDDDIHRRYALAGYDSKIANGALVYHFVSKTSRIGDYQQIEIASNKAYIRKWGSRFSKAPKYDIGFRVSNCSVEALSALEPWCSTISSDASYSQWLEEEQKSTKFDMWKRVKPWNAPLDNDIVVEFDASKLTQQSFQLIQQLSQIIAESGEVGDFELDIFKIKIKALNTYETKLITNSDPYYISQLLQPS